MTHPSGSQLHAYAVGSLFPAEEDALSAHLDRCSDCARRLAEFDAASDPLVAQLVGLRLEKAMPDEHLQKALAVVKATSRAEATSAPILRGSPASACAAAPMLRRLREYELLSKLGEGGMGTVYQARHTKLDKLVAIKLLPASRMESATDVARFEREMRAVGKLEHPHLIRAHDAGEVDGQHFLVMEYVRGCDLAQLIRKVGPLGVADACELVRQAALGLAHAHEHGLVHRDIKPSNIMLAASGQVKILDLGLALLQGDPASDSHELTSAGNLMGTIDYMAPEQAGHSHEVDHRSDIYSLGATLYKLLTGRAPLFDASHNTPVKKVMALATDSPQPVSGLRPDVPAELAAFVMSMLAKSPAGRPASAVKVAAEIGKWTAGSRLDQLLRSAEERVEESHDLTKHDTSHGRDRLTTSQAQIVVSTPTSALGKRTGALVRRAVWIWIAAGLASVACGVWIIVHDKEGNIVGQWKVPQGGSAAIVTDENDVKPFKPPRPPTSALNETEEVARWALRSGGKVTVEVNGDAVNVDALDKLPPAPFRLKGVNLARRPVRNHDLERLAGLPHLESLDLSDTGVGDAALKHLEGLPALNHLSLVNAKITDSAFDSLIKLPLLSHLSITGTKTTPEGWRRLSELPKLARLHVAMMPFGDADLAHLLEQPPKLQLLNLWGSAVTDAGMANMSKLTDLRTLYLTFTKVTGRSLAALGDLPHLEALHLPVLAKADEAAKGLSRSQTLQTLTIHHESDLTDQGMMYLGRIKSLRELKLPGSDITNAGLADLVDLPQLSSLQLHHPPITDEGAEALGQLRELTRLELREVMSDKGLESLSGLQKLEELHFSGNRLTDVGLAHLARLPSLRLLECSDAPFTDNGLMALAETKTLATLILRNSRVTSAGVERLHQVLPKTDIQVKGN